MEGALAGTLFSQGGTVDYGSYLPVLVAVSSSEAERYCMV